MNVTGGKSTTTYIRTRTTVVDNEGSKTKGYASPVLLKGILVPLSGQVQVTMYGEQAKYMLEMYIPSNTIISELDGICIHVDQNATPDYEVVSIFDYRKVKQLVLRKRVNNG